MRCVLALIVLLAALGSAGAQPGAKVKPTVAMKAQPFDLAEVKILEGPFQHAMEMDLRYLRSLPPDRLLHNFRVTAGLPSTAQPLGGWEEPNCEVRGHFVGHYLTACAMAYRATHDNVLKANADRVVAGMAECQARFPSGYLSAFPETFFDRLEALQPVWVPWYTLHKVYQGLIDMYTLTGNRQALDVVRRAAAWAMARTQKLSDDQLQKVLNTEHGGINETFANLYAVTGDKRYLDLSRRFNHRALLDPLARGEDRLTGLHANTQFPKVIGAARQYELTGDMRMRGAAEFFWNVVTRERSYVIGGNSDGEAFSPKEELSKHLGISTTETCNTYNMLKLTRHVFSWNADPEMAAYYERALYNHILASQNPETGMMSYYVPLKTGASKAAKTPFGFSEPFDSFWCCTGTGIENHVKYGDSIYWKDGSRGLFVNLFIASELNWRERGIRIHQTTRFPEEQATRLQIASEKPVRFALHIRRPIWAGNSFAVSVNGVAMQSARLLPGYFTITRTWKQGDVVQIGFPMSLYTQAFRDDPNRLALLFGPLVLCAQTTPSNSSSYIVGSASAAVAALKPATGRTLEFDGPSSLFRTSFDQSVAAVRFLPFYREYGHPHVVYWDVIDAATWDQRKADHDAEVAHEREKEGRTVDRVKIGDAASEREHNLQGERTGSGPLGDHMWRHATDGGWFSYDLRVAADTPLELVATLWGSDAGARTFDVLIDGVRIATETLANNAPGKLFDRTYQLGSELIAGKQKITVRFQGHPGNFAGGLFGLRVLRRATP